MLFFDKPLLSDRLNTYNYDANGSQTKKTNTGSGNIQELVYNLENRISTVMDNGVEKASYYYDPFGRRLWKEVGGVRTYALYTTRSEEHTSELQSH